MRPLVQYGYRLVFQYQPSTQRSIRFPYLDGIPRPIPRDQIIKRLIKQILLTLRLAAGIPR
jgi:hypothetical protein